MTNDQIIQSSLDRLSEAINKELASIPSDALGDVLVVSVVQTHFEIKSDREERRKLEGDW